MVSVWSEVWFNPATKKKPKPTYSFPLIRYSFDWFSALIATVYKKTVYLMVLNDDSATRPAALAAWFEAQHASQSWVAATVSWSDSQQTKQ